MDKLGLGRGLSALMGEDNTSENMDLFDQDNRKILDLKESYQKMKEDLLHSSSKFLPSLTNY